MMKGQKNLINILTKEQRKELFQNLYYMDMEEVKVICSAWSIPFHIYIETPNKTLKKAGDLDRKGIILDRIKYYLETGEIKKPTIFPKSVVSKEKLPPVLKSNHKVLYGQYKNKNETILLLLKELTNSEFEFGAIAQEVIRSCWSNNHAPTYKEFAKLWLEAKKLHNQPNPEWAYLSDRKKGLAGTDWKRLRVEKAQLAIKVLKSLKPINTRKAR